MSTSSRSTRLTLNRRDLLRLSTVAGVGAVIPGTQAFAAARDIQGPDTPAGRCSTPRSAVAKTKYGKVRGYVEDGVLTFKGVPYGAATGGENRWLPAKPPKRLGRRAAGADLRRQLPAAPARLGQRADVPLPVDRRLAERRHAQGEHLDVEPDRQASRDGLPPRRRLLLRLGLRTGVAGRRADGAASRRRLGHRQPPPQHPRLPRRLRDRRPGLCRFRERRHDRSRRRARSGSATTSPTSAAIPTAS